MDTLLLVITLIMIVLSIVGCVIPAIPGPILGYGALWCFYPTIYSSLSMTYMLILGGVTLVVFLADYFLPPLIAKKFGGGKQAAWGSIIGMLVGMFIPPIGIIIGMLVGAFVGEYFFAQTGGLNSFSATVGTFLGFVLGTGLKLLLCFYILYEVIAELYFYVSGLI